MRKYYIWGIKALVFAIPLLSVWIATSMYFPYITGRNFAFRVLVELALVLYISLAVLNKEYRPKSNLIFLAVIVFVGIVGIANLLGVNPYKSFWSNYERMEGYLTILHLGAYFLVLTNVFRTKKEWLTLFNIFLVAGLLVGSYGLLQVLGLKEAIQGGGVRVDGTIGNPTYLAVYLTFIIGIGLLLFFNATKPILRKFYLGAILFSLLIMFFTASRGAALAFGVATPLFLILYLIFFGKEEKGKIFIKIAIGILAAMVILPALFLLVKNQPWVQEHPVLSRFTNLSLGEKTVRSRFMIWGISFKGFLERPILGWGQENFIQVFAKYYDPGLYDQEPWFDRSHNIFFDWLSNAGILGLASYLALFGTFFALLSRGVKEAIVSRKEWLVLLVLPIIYFTQNIFVFDNLNTYILFFTFLAYVNSWKNFSIPTKSISSDSTNALIVLIAGGLAVIPLIYFGTLKPIAQSQGIISGLMATADPQNAIIATKTAFERALAYDTFGHVETLEQLGRVTRLLIDRSDVPKETQLDFLNFTASKLEAYLEKSPNDIRLHLFLGDIYQSAANIDQEYSIKARNHFLAASALSPNKQQILTALANNFLLSDDLNQALGFLQKAVDLEPSNIGARGNLAVYALLVGRNDIVQNQIVEMSRVGAQKEKRNEPTLGALIEQLVRIGNAYRNIGQIENAKIVYAEIVRIYPQNDEYRQILQELK